MVAQLALANIRLFTVTLTVKAGVLISEDKVIFVSGKTKVSSFLCAEQFVFHVIRLKSSMFG